MYVLCQANLSMWHVEAGVIMSRVQQRKNCCSSLIKHGQRVYLLWMTCQLSLWSPIACGPRLPCLASTELPMAR
jgi:hypothetical protein